MDGEGCCDGTVFTAAHRENHKCLHLAYILPHWIRSNKQERESMSVLIAVKQYNLVMSVAVRIISAFATLTLNLDSVSQ